MTLIGISGHAQSGKDTIADILILSYIWDCSESFQDIYPVKHDFIKRFIGTDVTSSTTLKYQKVSFAFALKVLLSQLTKTKLKLWNTEKFKAAPNKLGLCDSNHIYTNRELLQKFGTEVGRAIDSDLWIKALFRSFKKGYAYIISDVRFKNEAEALKNKGAFLIRVNRNIDQMSHISETNLDDYSGFDIVINNNGTIDDLIDQCMCIELK